jgi:hypothetical protein
MFYKAKVTVCSEISTKHINEMWAPRRIFSCQTWWFVKVQLGFKRLSMISLPPPQTRPFPPFHTPTRPACHKSTGTPTLTQFQVT